MTKGIAINRINLFPDSLRKYNYHNFGYYPLSYLEFKTRRFGDWIIELVSVSGHQLRKLWQPFLLGPSEWVPYGDGDRIQSPKCHVLK
jgi:hypothetical protein